MIMFATIVRKYLVAASVFILCFTAITGTAAEESYVPVSWNQLIPADYDLEALEKVSSFTMNKKSLNDIST